MSASLVAQATLLGLVVLTCWTGTLGVFRMRDPTQALHFITIPAAVGSLLLTAAVFVRTGNGTAGWKMLLIAGMMIALNSVGMHASARAFRARKLGHWEPRDGDDLEWVRRGAEEEPEC